jgi:replicative superfamily II helicase
MKIKRFKTTKQTQANPLKKLAEQMFDAKGRKLLKTIKWQMELWTNPLYSTAKKIVIAAGTSAGKSLALSGKLELEKLMKQMDFYYRNESKHRKKTLICPSGTNVLKDNMVDTFTRFNPSFSYKVVYDRHDLIDAVKGDYDVIIALPQVCMANIDLLPKIDLFVLDEAHTWYFAKKGNGTIHEIIKKTQPTQEILLTGTPFVFQTPERKKEFTFL